MHGDSGDSDNNNNNNNRESSRGGAQGASGSNSQGSGNVSCLRVPNQAQLKERLGKACGNPSCNKIHGKKSLSTGEIIRLSVKCKECYAEYYCSKMCREKAKRSHEAECKQKQLERREQR